MLLENDRRRGRAAAAAARAIGTLPRAAGGRGDLGGARAARLGYGRRRDPGRGRGLFAGAVAGPAREMHVEVLRRRRGRPEKVPAFGVRDNDDVREFTGDGYRRAQLPDVLEVAGLVQAQELPRPARLFEKRAVVAGGIAPAGGRAIGVIPKEKRQAQRMTDRVARPAARRPGGTVAGVEGKRALVDTARLCVSAADVDGTVRADRGRLAADHEGIERRVVQAGHFFSPIVVRAWRTMVLFDRLTRCSASPGVALTSNSIPWFDC